MAKIIVQNTNITIISVNGDDLFDGLGTAQE